MNPSLLICPLCAGSLSLAAGALRCANQHSFDIARQGYVNLLPVQQKKSRHPGDSKDMVAARTRFLNTATYEPIARQLVASVGERLPATGPVHLLDAGCGEGYYLDYLVRALTAGNPAVPITAVGLDISKEAVAAAAKRNSEITWIVGTNAHPPVASAVIDSILCVFGFPSFEGFKRLLKPGGNVLLVDPGPDHLIELREVIYPTVKRSPPPSLAAAEALGFRLAGSTVVRYRTDPLEQADLRNLLAMTPYLYRATPEGREAADRLQRLAVTVEVVVRTLRLD